VFIIHGKEQNVMKAWVMLSSKVMHVCMNVKAVEEDISVTDVLMSEISLISGKVVTFGGADHYAEETPLMFSRCSSLGSLSSIEQHSIHDDRSSVISDFR
jgi:hypothetical protein